MGAAAVENFNPHSPKGVTGQSAKLVDLELFQPTLPEGSDVVPELHCSALPRISTHTPRRE